MSEIVLPKKDKNGEQYVSYSQLSTWKRNKRDYIRQYFFGEGFEGNDYTDFGSKIGEALENNDFSGFTKDEQEILKSIPRYDEFEREIKYKFDGFYIKGFIDTNTKVKKHKLGMKYISHIADYKTGDMSKKASEYQSDDYNQLDLYAGAMLQEFGRLPDHVCVYLIDRKGNAYKNEKLKLGEGFMTVKKEVTPERIAAVKKEVETIVKEISDCYKVFLKLQNLK